MENLVLLELQRKSDLSSTFEIYYWKEYGRSDGKEVDFVIKKRLGISQLIQVTHISARDEMNTRETNSLIAASDGLKCSNLLVITWDYGGKEQIDGKNISFIPLWEWLLS